MKRILRATIAGTMIFAMAHAIAGERYPTVREFEAGLHVAPGAQLPKEVAANGRAWGIYYLGARSLGGGVYEVRLRVR